MKKNITVLIVTIILLCSLTNTAFASDALFENSSNAFNTSEYEWGIDITQEHDMINGNNAYLDFKDRFKAMGLNLSQVKSLQSQGFSYNRILQLTTAQLRELLPSYGLRALRVAPSTYVRVTGCGSGGNSTVYFHPNTGYTAGTWSANGGTTTHTKIDNLAKAVYGGTSGVTRYYHYWGHWTDDYKTHQGIDMYKNEGDAIKSAHSGTVVTVGTLGRVGIYNSTEKVTYFYAHMKDRTVSVGSTVSVGDTIGYQSNVGAGGSHLHFEVRTGNTTSMGLQNENLNTKNPYNYL